MSIAGLISQGAATNSITISDLPFFIFPAVSIVLAIMSRVHQPKLISGVERVPGPGRLVGLGLVLMMGLFAWILTQTILASMILRQWHAAGHSGTPADFESILTPRQLALLSFIPPLPALFVILFCDRLVDPDLPRTLGIGPIATAGSHSRIGQVFLSLIRPLGLGLLALIIIYPWILWVNFLAEYLYQKFHYVHPNEHPLLKSFGETNDRESQAMIIISATIIAPLFEEILFRGHLQTLLRQGLLSMSERMSRPAMGVGMPAMPSSPAPGNSPPLLLEYSTPPVRDPKAPVRPVWPSWVAVILTSILFAAVHPSWSYPAIFVLALALGYLYERTANLWNSIVLHMLFNSLQMAQFIFMQMHKG